MTLFFFIILNGYFTNHLYVLFLLNLRRFCPFYIFLLTTLPVVRGVSSHFANVKMRFQWDSLRTTDTGEQRVSRTPLLAWDAVSLKVWESVCGWLCIKTVVLWVKSLIALLAHSWNSFQWKQSHCWSQCVSRVWPANPWILPDSQLESTFTLFLCGFSTLKLTPTL